MKRTITAAAVIGLSIALTMVSAVAAFAAVVPHTYFHG